jgi:hypothetical protein
MGNQEILPASLFGLMHSNRDFSHRESWGKNQFNNSFPASLACYMSYIGLKLIYLKLDEELKIWTLDKKELFAENISEQKMINLVYSFLPL